MGSNICEVGNARQYEKCPVTGKGFDITLATL